MDSELLKTEKRLTEARRTLKVIKQLTLSFRSVLDEDLRPLGITLAQLRVLHAVKNEATASGAQIARDYGVTPQTAHALILLAEKKGWLLREADPTNERRRISKLTEQGEKLLAETEVIVKRIETRMWDGVKRSDLKQMNDLLEAAAGRL